MNKNINKISIKDLYCYYKSFLAIENVNINVPKNKITAFIGPSGCGKSTVLRSINRMNDLVLGSKINGEISINFNNEICNVYESKVDVTQLRKRVGMVFQKPNPFKMSIYDNVAYGPRLFGFKRKQELNETVEKSLRNAALWNEVKDKLHKSSAFELSGGQQQRLCIARALAVNPEILLMDEPCSSLDPLATVKIEDLLIQLKEELTVVIVTHNMQQASRISDMTAVFWVKEENKAGELIEYKSTVDIFSRPQDPRTEGYITGRFG